MNKQMIMLAAAGLAATSMASTAEAGRGGRGFHFGGPSHHVHSGGFHRGRQWSPSFAPTYVQEAPRVRRPSYAAAPQMPPKMPAMAFADGQGRVFDRTSLVWFDGVDQCFTGDKPFVYRGGSWFYGPARWTQTNGSWQTTAAQGPIVADCNKVPTFAAKIAARVNAADKTAKASDKKDTQKKVAKKSKSDDEVQTAEQDAGDKPQGSGKAECKKYFPNIGQVLPVPCSE